MLLKAMMNISPINQQLRRKKKSLVLRLDESRAALATYPAMREFEALADWLGLKPKVKVGSFKFGGEEEEEE